MNESFRKFVIVIWKSFICWRRYWLINLVEFVIPLIIFAFVLIIYDRLDAERRESQGQTVSNTIGNREYKPFSYKDSKLLYTPDTIATETIMKSIAKQDDNGHPENIFAFKTEDLLEKYFESNNTDKTYGIIFRNINNSTDFKYEVRSKIPSLPGNNGFRHRNFSESPATFDNRFLSLHVALTMAYVQHISEESSPYKVTAKTSQNNQNPHLVMHYTGPIMILYIIVVPFLIPFSFIVLSPSLIKKIVEEKQSGLKAMMQMVGLKTWMIWTGWMVNTLAIYSFSCAAVTLLLCVGILRSGPLYEYTNWTIVFVLFVLFAAASASFAFVISSCFSRSSSAMVVGVVVWIILLNSLMPVKPKSVILKMVVGLIPTMSIVWGIRVMTAFEERNEVLSWETLFTKGNENEDDISMGLIYITLIFSTIVFLLIASYLDAIFPGEFGTPKKWYFIFQIYSFRKKKPSVTVEEEVKQNTKFEPPRQGYKMCIQICNLRKTFGPYFTAVKGISLDIYEGQITVMLGHNGAGKTTTMSILTGMIPPTSGTILYKGENIFRKMRSFQKNIGLCPQHNLLFAYLTVMEHLIFFGMLKGLSYSEAKKEGLRVLNVLSMEKEKSQMFDKMSGGMKRKLCLAIALLDNPQILILDEPSSGMDPESRRELWNILLDLRSFHTIIITTHFMEEADVLGDRIAIMDHGVIHCCGSTLFLKQMYGTGYNLTLEKSDSTNVDNITSLIESSIKGAQLKSSSKISVTYTLPQERTHDFPKFFSNLERSKSSYGIESISITWTTMEDVFLKVGGVTDISEESLKYLPRNTRGSFRITLKSSGILLAIRQFQQLLYKRILCTWRNIYIHLMFMIFPITMLLLQLSIAIQSNKIPSPTTPIISPPYNFNSPLAYIGIKDMKDQKLVKKYENLTEKEGFIAKNVPSQMANEIRISVVTEKEFNSTSEKALFSKFIPHPPPIAMNFITQTIQKKPLTRNNMITTTNQLFITDVRCNPIGVIASSTRTSLKWLLAIPIGMTVLISLFIPFPLSERVSKLKHIQFMTGVPPIVYWLTCFIVDYIVNVVIPTGLMVIVILVADTEDMFTGYKSLGLFSLISLLYGLSGGICAYFYSFFTETPQFAMLIFISVNLLFGAVPSSIIYILKILDIVKNPKIIVILNNIFSLNPYFAMANAFGYYAKITATTKYCNDCSNVLPECHDLDYYTYKDDAVAMYITYLMFDWVLYLICVLLIDHGYVKLAWHCIRYRDKKKSHLDYQETGDEDVKNIRKKAEQYKFISPYGDDIALTVTNLEKKFGHTCTAVEGVSFQVSTGECFGLLGTNGAGKTTIFRLLSGDLIPNNGDARIMSNSLSANRKNFLKDVGYCPQIDSLNELLTAKELIHIFGILRGIPSKHIKFEVNDCLRLLGLTEYRNRQCGHYSGGNKRKLCTALALIGDPKVILLDEPTTGVDPVSRRNMWKVLRKCQKYGQCIVLTSHSMEECEELCTNLTVVVKGDMKCIGSTNHLKKIYGRGYTILIKLFYRSDMEGDLKLLKKDMNKIFSSKCNIIEENMFIIDYHMVDSEIPISTIFGNMESIASTHKIVEEYFVSDTTLEQVFLLLARN